MVSHLAIATDGLWSEDGGGDTYIYNLPINLELEYNDIDFNLDDDEIYVFLDSNINFKEEIINISAVINNAEFLILVS